MTRAGIIPQERDGTYAQREAVQGLLKNYRARLTIAEGLCHRFMPGELEARYEDMSDA